MSSTPGRPEIERASQPEQTAGMWTTRAIDAGRAPALRFALERQSHAATYSDVVEAWRSDADFRAWFNAQVAGVPFTAFRWETPPVTTATASRRFEFVVLNDPGLARDADPEAFAEHFRGRSGSDVLSFPNIGGDAIMVVPRPLAPPSTYAHLATFVRNAPESQRHALWKSVGDAMSRRLSARPVWLSTAGAGVPWLHVRLDDRPKYYGFTPYRDPRA
jgi:hypothetical protein